MLYYNYKIFGHCIKTYNKFIIRSRYYINISLEVKQFELIISLCFSIIINSLVSMMQNLIVLSLEQKAINLLFDENFI